MAAAPAESGRPTSELSIPRRSPVSSNEVAWGMQDSPGCFKLELEIDVAVTTGAEWMDAVGMEKGLPMADAPSRIPSARSPSPPAIHVSSTATSINTIFESKKRGRPLSRHLSSQRIPTPSPSPPPRHMPKKVRLDLPPSPVLTHRLTRLLIPSRKPLDGIGVLITHVASPDSTFDLASLTATVHSLGGTVLQLASIFSLSPALSFRTKNLREKRILSLILLAERPHSSIKYRVALALGIPCVSWHALAYWKQRVRIF